MPSAVREPLFQIAYVLPLLAAAVVGCASSRPVAAPDAPTGASPDGPPRGDHGGGEHAHGGPGDDHAHGAHGMPHRFEHAEDWTKVFDAEDRDAWQRPDEVIAAMGVTDGALVADVGAGTGYFSARLAKRFPKSKVYAADVEADMVRYLGDRAKKEGLSNLVPVLSTADDAKLPEAVDVILIVDTIHHIEHREAYFAKLRAALRPGGKIVVVDFLEEATMGPPKEHRLPAARVTKEAEAAGLTKRSESKLPQQYVLVLGAR